MFKIILVILLFLFNCSCTKKNVLPDVSKTNQLILEGAKKEIINKTKYNTFLLKNYVKTNYKNGNKCQKSIYPNGDIDPKHGVCTDLVIRALRNADIDLQKDVYNDVKNNLKYFGIKKADWNIDHRRVWMLQKYFKREYINLSTKLTKDNSHWKPGDIIIWDIGSKEHLHIGIISDKRTKKNIPYAIHNMKDIPFIFPGKTVEQNVLSGPKFFGFSVWKWKIIGHYRV